MSPGSADPGRTGRRRRLQGGILLSRSLYLYGKERLESLFSTDDSQIPRGRRWLLRLGKLLYLTLRKINTTLCLERAASLSFTATISMIPLAILLVFVFDTFGSFEPAREEVRGFLQEYVADDLQLQAQQWMDEFEHELQGTKAALQGFAFVFLIIAALALYRSSERTFSVIWNVTVQRGFFRKLGTFWLILTLAPLILSGSLYVRESLSSRLTSLEDTAPPNAVPVEPEVPWQTWEQHELDLWTGGSVTTAPTVGPVAPSAVPGQASAGGVGWGTWFLRWFRMFVVSWLFPTSVSFFAFTIVYVYLPNARVKLNTAAVAAFGAACCWQLATWGFTRYVETAPGFRVYGVLGLIPSFLMWIYLSWVIVLAGTALSYCLQNFEVLEREVRFHFRRERIARPIYALLFLERIYRGFGNEQPAANPETLATEFRVPLSEAEGLLEVLDGAGLVVADSTGVITPQRSADQVSPLDVMQAFPVGAGYRLPPGWEEAQTPLAQSIRRIADELEGDLSRQTFQDLLARSEA